MTCRELVEFLDDYIAGDLPTAQKQIFEEHLAECEDCENYLGSYKTTISLSKAAGKDDAVPADVPDKLVRAVLAARRARK
jgi:anti-sigma factor RsiW